MLFALITGLSVILPCASSAQQTARPERPWSVSVSRSDAGNSGSANGVELAMRRGGFGDRLPCFFGCPGGATPFSIEGQDQYALSISRQVTSTVHVRLVAAAGDPGSTHGYREEDRGFGVLEVQRSASTLALMVGVSPSATSGVWLATGPSLNQVGLSVREVADGSSDQAIRPGA